MDHPAGADGFFDSLPKLRTGFLKIELSTVGPNKFV
jgi:hypothetical protein